MVKNRRNDRVYWRCATRTCPATIRTLNNIPIGFNLVHNHPPNPAKLEVTKVLQHIKKRCRAETTPVPAIYKQEIAKLRTPEWNDDTQRMVEQLPTFPSLKSSLYRQREDLIPHLPTSLLNIDLQDEWTQTTAAERFLLINDGTFDKILVFATDSNLQHLANNDNNTIYADGTFYTCPSIFEQLYTLHALIDGEMFPLVFALLPGKSEDIYTRFFSLLKNACTQRQIQLNPTTFFIDYESAYHAGGVRPTKRRKYTQLNQRLQQLKDQLQNGDITVFQFADTASYLLHLD
ncbi:unnamed protein product [Mytilus edulis]|uniref:MULE transposase domain-containing protein n=1 Tax=Mytilus edulis TaxID=6550 RepID=A0A8S3QPS6_MYTED|nr:unnamed protein product [Mytilus edulis]